jgi:hypothetical protein
MFLRKRLLDRQSRRIDGSKVSPLGRGDEADRIEGKILNMLGSHPRVIQSKGAVVYLVEVRQ